LDKINIRTWVIVLIIIAFAALRGLSPSNLGEWANFTPVGAIALFGGIYFKNRIQAYFFPLLVLLVSDIFINYGYFGKITLFYEGIFWVYLSFALIVLVGQTIKNVRPLNVLLSALVTVLIHWIVTDFGVWLNNPAFEQTPAGFLHCLVLAIPFEKNFLAGTLLYTTVMVGGFELLKAYLPKLTPVRVGE